MANAAATPETRARQTELHNLLKTLRPAAQLAVSAYSNTNVFSAPDWPNVYTSEQLEIWTQAAFNNTQVHIALVEEWDDKYKKKDAPMNVAGVFAFRGTQPWSLSDWLIDFDYEKKAVDWWLDPGDSKSIPGKDIVSTPVNGHINGMAAPMKSKVPMAHGGFLYAFNSVAVRPWPSVINTPVPKPESATPTPRFESGDRDKTLDAALKRQIKVFNLRKGTDLDASKLTRIICTGHSLGGALATLAAVWTREVLTTHLEKKPVPHVTCVTLGSPLVGDKRFAEMFLELQHCKGGTSKDTLDCTRIIHAMDPVPMVPPAQWGFEHVGCPMWFDKQMTVPDHFEWRYLVAMDLALATTYIGETRYRQSVWGQIMDQTLAFLDSTFGGVANIKRLSMVVKEITGDTHKFVTQISPWGGRLLSEYGGALWRSLLAPAEVVVFFATMAISLLDG
ncbi:probable lipase at C-terminar half [Coccomyxa sp. Obi]|nr:probable lipase at C-terminar half [Coccomyxa sp. Obi]